MTPIKTIVLFGASIMVRDMADQVELKAVCTNERDAEWLARSLANYHNVPLETLDVPAVQPVVAK